MAVAANVHNTQVLMFVCREFGQRRQIKLVGRINNSAMASPEGKMKREKKPSPGREEGRLPGKEPDLKVNKNNTVCHQN